MSCDLFEIDGSILEGGGQILRTALTLSAIRKIPIRIKNIRAGRSKPGLMEQHLKGVELVKDLCNGQVRGATYGSTEVELYPNELTGGSYKASVKTAGSIALLLQVALPCSLFAKTDTKLILRGGTNADMAPQIDYITEVFRPNLDKFGGTFDFNLIKRGYFPKGGGEVVFNIKSLLQTGLKPVSLLEFGNITALYGWSFVAGSLPIKLSHLMADSAINLLKKNFNNIQIERYKEDRQMAPDNCFGIILVAETNTGCILGGSALGKRNENADDVGKRAAIDLLKAIDKKACIDEYCQDQLIVFMALVNGISKIYVGEEITSHTKTAIFVAEKLTNAKFELIPYQQGTIIQCTGAL